MNYTDAEKASWLEVEKGSVHTGVNPHSIHFPLNIPQQNYLIYCDCAFNVYRLDVPPDMRANDINSDKVRADIRLPLVSFAFDEPAFIPDFRQSIWERIGGSYPMAHGRLYATLMQYDLEYALDPDDSTIYIRCTVTNNDEVPRQGVIRCLQSRPLEQDVMDYHYYPFHWDNSNWAKLTRDELQPQVIENGGFDLDLNNSVSFEDSQYNTRFLSNVPYVVTPQMRLTKASGMLCASRKLGAGESASFTLAVNFAEKVFPKEKTFDSVCSKNRRFWDALRSECRIEFADQEESDCFDSLQWNSLQLLLELDSPTLGKVLQPSQGGSSERFYVWVWEAMCSLRPMLKLGHFEPVRKVLEFIFKLQDGGTPPVGRFHSLKGAIGTTGPRWANATGSALLLAVDYVIYSKDKVFLKKYMPKMLRAAKWILGEVEATRRYNPDGTKQLGFGVMPFACATDADQGYVIVWTDAWSFAGAANFALLLKMLNAPEYEQINAAVENYRTDLSNAIDSVRRENGFIDRKLSEEGSISRAFDKLIAACNFLETDFASPEEERFRKFIAYREKNVFEGPFTGPLFERIYYIGNGEQNMFYVYCKLHEWKKAYLAAETFRQCGMTRDLHLTQERYSTVDSSFAPWQPNASNNGRYLNMMIRRLYLENGENEIILFGGIAPSGMLSGKNYSVRNLYTYQGKVSLALHDGIFTLEREEIFPAGIHFAFPDYMIISSDAFEPIGDNVFALKKETGRFTGKITIDPVKLL